MTVSPPPLNELRADEATWPYALSRTGWMWQPLDNALLSVERHIGGPAGHDQEGTGMERRCGFQLAALALGICFAPGHPGAAAPADARQVIAATAAAMAAKGEFAGAILIAREDIVLLRQAYGLAAREKKSPATPETKFRLGSMNKMFTAVAILQLVEAGRVSLDEPLVRYLPDYPNRDVSTQVTIRHLLTHTGGTGDFFGPEYARRRTELREHSDFLKLFGNRGLVHPAGAAVRYSNYGFVLLGAIIERVSTSSYFDYVRAKIFVPVGMLSTDSPPMTELGPDAATGYVKQADEWTANTSTLGWRGTAAGGGYSTLGDLHRFALALQTGTLISPATLAQATAPHRKGVSYGYGFVVTGEGDARAYGHGGSAPGMNAELRVYPSTGEVFVALANLGQGAASRLLRMFDQAR